MGADEISETLELQLQIENELSKFFKTATPVTLKKKLESLPTAVAQQFQYLNTVLKVLDELDVAPVQVFALLETVRPVVYHRTRALLDRFLGKNVALPKQVQDVIASALTLQSHLSSSYDNVVAEAKYQGDAQAFIMGSAIQRALADKTYLLRCYLLLYIPVPPQLWKQLHKLYKISDEYKLLGQTMSDPVVFSEKLLSIKSLYLYSMLLGCSQTSHMSASEILSFTDVLLDWLQLVKVTDKVEERLACKLIADLDSGKPPLLRGQLENQAISKAVYINIDKLIDRLNDIKAEKVHVMVGKQKDFSKQCIDHLLSAWSQEKPMATDRVERADAVTLCIGLDSVYYHLSDGVELEDVLKKMPLPESEPDGRIVTGEIPREFKFDIKASSEIKKNASYPCIPVRVVDESKGGYCLEWPMELLSRLSVGEIVAIKEKMSLYWKVGEIVWMRQDENKKLRTGVSLLSATGAIPLVARVPKKFGNRGNYIKTLLIPDDKEINRPAVTYLVPNIGLQMGERVWVVQGADRRGLQLLQSSKEGKLYTHFECAYLL